jgi:hypothetical protein
MLVAPTDIPCELISKFNKKSYFININPTFLKLWICTHFNMIFPVVVLVFDFDEFSEGMLHDYWKYIIEYFIP